MSAFGPEQDPRMDIAHASHAGGYGKYYEDITVAQHAYTVLGRISEESDFMTPDYVTEDDVMVQRLDVPSEQACFDAVEEVELAVRDAVELDYIDFKRTPNGIHCMDYCIDEAGIQLPGGELWVRVFRMLMDPSSYVRDIREAINIAVNEMRDEGIKSFVHNGCAAAKNLLPALTTNLDSMSEAREFVIPMLNDLDLVYSGTERDIDTAIFVGGRRAEIGYRLWADLKPENEDGTKLAIELGLPHEELDKSGKIVAGGLAIFTTSNRFNNQLFRQNHQTGDGKEVGLYAVTAGAQRDMLVARREKEEVIARTIQDTLLLTHGLARYLGGDYLRARVIAPKT